MYSPHIKMLETPAKDYSDWKSTQTEGKSDNVYVLGNGNWTISTAQQVHIASGIKDQAMHLQLIILLLMIKILGH